MPIAQINGAGIYYEEAGSGPPVLSQSCFFESLGVCKSLNS
jgi:hypothetical protein